MRWLVLALILAGCAVAPQRVEPMRARSAIAVTNPRVVLVPWKFAPGTVMSNYFWSLETSADLQHWTTAQFPYDDATLFGTGTPGPMFFRVKGIPIRK